jgi:hypothetical protein
LKSATSTNVLDGGIDPFIFSCLMAKKPKVDIQLDDDEAWH